MTLQVKAGSVDKIRLENGKRSVQLSVDTSQDILAEFYQTEIGKEHIEVAPSDQSEDQAAGQKTTKR